MKDTDWEILHELYRNPNMTKVANKLYITQPSLTKRLQHMEMEFQITIVNRTPKGLEFTPEGEFLAKQAAKYQEFMKETLEKLKEFKEKVQGTILIGSAYTYSKYTLTDILVRYTASHPQTNFEILNEPSNLLFRRMLEGSIDAGFVRGDYEGPVNQVLVERNQGYLVTKEPIELNNLLTMQKISYKSNDKSRALLDGWWQDRFGTEPPQGMSIGYIDFAWQLIDRGMGYTYCFLPPNFRNEYGLFLTPLERTDGSKVIRNTWFVYSKNKRMPKVLEEFVWYIEKEIAIK